MKTHTTKAETNITCPICGKNTNPVKNKKPGWGCETKTVYMCSCGWRSK